MAWRLVASAAAMASLLLGGCIEEHPDFVFIDTDGTQTGTTGVDPLGTESVGPSTGGSDPSGGSTGSCVPAEETCNGVDDDCDDEVDEGCDCVDGDAEACFSGMPAEEGVGACTAGMRTCDRGTWGACEGETLPVGEECNGVDDDCDGVVDEDFGQIMCGVGICMVVVDACIDGDESTCVPGEPLLDEECNGLDDDCDGDVDELPCECLNGETQACYTGSEGTSGVGLCADGTQTCADGVWGSCEDAVIPVPEVCDGEDNDCDGDDDNGDPGAGNACLTQLPGVCSQGVTACTGGEVVCEQTVFSSPEVCDGFDNNCNTGIDEGNPGGGDPCDTGLDGICATGETLCQGGNLGCQQTVSSGLESCNGLDDDCDGDVDENNPEGGQPCSTGLDGACGTGVSVCNSPDLDCTQTVFSQAETCNGVDDDCDGVVDNGAVGSGDPCPTGLDGVCSVGEADCTGGSPVCNQTVFASSETCDGLDNNCDGTVDDGNPGGGAACSTGLDGVCGPGTQMCVDGGIICVSNVSASAETCDGLDNDCDGTVDNGNPEGGQACNTGLDGVCAAGTTACENGSPVCNQNVASSAELCDGLDNDCDGTVDEDDPEGGQACNTGLDGVCAAGTTECLTGGALDCNQNVLASAETCDDLDNNCDGNVDEGDPGGGQACSTGLFGVCAAGTTECADGEVDCVPDTTGSPEVCDGQDNDCDNATDENDPGGGVPCSTGLDGVCGAGTTACEDGAIACNQNVQAATEECGDGLDNDCDGEVDNGCPCPDFLVDGTFEAGSPSTAWVETSTNFGTPLCTTAFCGFGGGTGPNGGIWWAWFGGFSGGTEIATLTQDLTIPTGSTAELTFFMELPVCAPAGSDVFSIEIDGIAVFATDNNDAACNQLGYAQQTIDISSFADNATHTLFMESITVAQGGMVTNFFIDDMAVLVCP